MKLDPIVKNEGEGQTIVRTFDLGSQLTDVVKLLIFLNQRIEHQGAHAFACRVYRRRSDRIDRSDVVAERDDKSTTTLAATGRKKEKQEKAKQQDNLPGPHLMVPPYV